MNDGEEAQPLEAEQDKGAWLLFWWQSPTPGQQVDTRTARQAGRALLLLFVVLLFLPRWEAARRLYFLLRLLYFIAFYF